MNKEILVFDTETTGIPDWKKPSGDPSQPHIVQLAALVVDTESLEITQSMDVIVKPDGWEIPKETTDIHGITNEHANDVGIPEADVVASFIALLGDKLRITHNTTFDNRIIRIGLKRYFPDLVDEFKAGEYYCTMMNAKKSMGGKNPKLIEAYKHFTGKELEGAHTAMADARACLDVYLRLHDITGDVVDVACDSAA